LDDVPFYGRRSTGRCDLHPALPEREIRREHADASALLGHGRTREAPMEKLIVGYFELGSSVLNVARCAHANAVFCKKRCGPLRVALAPCVRERVNLALDRFDIVCTRHGRLRLRACRAAQHNEREGRLEPRLHGASATRKLWRRERLHRQSSLPTRKSSRDEPAMPRAGVVGC
jgi:hypothetical protein